VNDTVKDVKRLDRRTAAPPKSKNKIEFFSNLFSR